MLNVPALPKSTPGLVVMRGPRRAAVQLKIAGVLASRLSAPLMSCYRHPPPGRCRVSDKVPVLACW